MSVSMLRAREHDSTVNTSTVQQWMPLHCKKSPSRCWVDRLGSFVGRQITAFLFLQADQCVCQLAGLLANVQDWVPVRDTSLVVQLLYMFVVASWFNILR